MKNYYTRHEAAAKMARKCPTRRRSQPDDQIPEPEQNLPARASSASNSLVLPYPPSANVYWRHVVIKNQPRVYVSAEAKEFRQQVLREAVAQDAQLVTGEVTLKIDVYRPRRVGDLDNRIKVLLDALQGVLFENDDQVVKYIPERFDDKHNPRVEVTVLSGRARETDFENGKLNNAP